MWQGQDLTSEFKLIGISEGHGPNISPYLLKNLNIHDVLEPQKVALVNNEDLIDLNSSNEKDFLTGPEPSTSITKEPYNSNTTNIFIKPPIVHMSKTQNRNQSNTQNIEDILLKKWDAELRNEKGENCSDQKSQNMFKMVQGDDMSINNYSSPLCMTKLNIDKILPVNQMMHTNEFSNKENVYMKESFDFLIGNKEYSYIESQAAEREDLIEEVLLTKSLEKLQLSADPISDKLNGVKVLSTPLTKTTTSNVPSLRSSDNNLNKFYLNVNNDIKTNRDEIILSSNVRPKNVDVKSTTVTSNQQKPAKLCLSQSTNLTDLGHSSSRIFEDSSPDIMLIRSNVRKYSATGSIQSEDSGFSSMSSKSYTSDNFFSKTTSNTDILLSLNHALQSLTKDTDAECSNSRNKQIILLNTPISPHALKLLPLQAIKKDPKKKYIGRSDIDKLTLTKGPDLSEKSVVLPQILDRLGKEKEHVIKEMNVKKRLLLDSGNTQTSAKINVQGLPVNLNPVTLMEDCNKERLIAHKSRQRFGNFIQDGSLL